jgi:Domain of unknown function (DUF3943)
MNKPVLFLAMSLICRQSIAQLESATPAECGSEARGVETEESLPVLPPIERLTDLSAMMTEPGSREAALVPAATRISTAIDAARLDRAAQPSFQWKSATADSFRFLMLQTAARLALQSKTRRGLQGPFAGGYLETFRSRPAGFFDGDSSLTNFVGHPVQGASTYHLARVNGGSREQAFWWGVLYSTQFELGPVGEASVGNVPISPVDLIVTPTAGFFLGVIEESLLMKINGIKNSKVRAILRFTLLGRSLTRMVSGK